MEAKSVKATDIKAGLIGDWPVSILWPCAVAALVAISACDGDSSHLQAPQITPAPEATPEAVTPAHPSTITTAKGIKLLLGPDRAEQINPKMVYSFQGKGTKLGWDLGVTQAAYERISLMRGEATSSGDIVLTGNSSGAALAAFFTCQGVTGDNIQKMAGMLRNFPEKIVNEDSSAKLPAVIDAMRNGLEIGEKHETILPFISQLTGDRCMPRYPTVIVASNQDINDNRRWIDSNEHRSRSFSIDDFSYSERTSTFTRTSFKVGKVCTYFADPVMFRYLTEHMTQEERLCDVRAMETVDDVRLAVLASIAEPTYFLPVFEPTEAKLERYQSDGFAKTRRIYNGGFSMPGVVQDVKRLFPSIRAFGTGRWDYGTTEVAALYSWYDLNLNSVQAHARWWFDVEAFPTGKEKDALLDRPEKLKGEALAKRYQEEIAMGYKRGAACLQRGKPCLPPRKTVLGIDTNKPAFRHPAGQPGGAEVKTRQGLDSLLE
jgi:hypothetical protein